MVACHLLWLGLLSGVAAQPVPVSVWVYHDFAPFVVDAEREAGLSFELAEALTERSDGQYSFTVQVVNRMRLNLWLAQERKGLVFWANSAWFEDSGKTRYLWSGALMRDRNVLVSRQDNPVEFQDPTSLIGLHMAGVSGHRYTGIDPLIAKDRVRKTELRSEKQVMQFVASGRADVAILPISAAVSYTDELELRDSIYFADNPHSLYVREILVHRDLADVHSYVQMVLPEILNSATWQAAMQRYSVTDR